MPKDAIIFRDEGKAYDTCFSKIQASAGIDKVIVYPPAVHELLSPNDNKVHGIAKERWRRCDFYKKDAVESSLSLLHFLRNVDGESISTFFTENFFYNSRTSFTKAEVEKVVMTSGKRRYQRINFFHDCEQLYERFIRGHYARGTQVQPTLRSPSTVIWTGTTGLYFAFCRSLCKRLCDQSSPSKLKIGQTFCHWVNSKNSSQF